MVTTSFIYKDKRNDQIKPLKENECEIEVKFNFSRDNAGCGVLRYARCYEAEIVDSHLQAIYGKYINLYVICPERLNGIRAKNFYDITIDFDLAKLKNVNINDECKENNVRIRKAILVSIH